MHQETPPETPLSPVWRSLNLTDYYLWHPRHPTHQSLIPSATAFLTLITANLRNTRPGLKCVITETSLLPPRPLGAAAVNLHCPIASFVRLAPKARLSRACACACACACNPSSQSPVHHCLGSSGSEKCRTSSPECEFPLSFLLPPACPITQQSLLLPASYVSFQAQHSARCLYACNLCLSSGGQGG